jgi:hypothetical protein
MQKFVCCLVVLCSCASGYAKGKHESFFISPLAKVSSLAGERASWAGLEVGCGLTENYSVSAVFSTLESEHMVWRQPGPSNESLPYQVTIAYAGARFSYKAYSRSGIHSSLGIAIGDGWLGLATPPIGPGARDRFLIIEPSLRSEARVLGPTSVTTGISYMVTNGIHRFGFDDRDVSGLNWFVGLAYSIK